MNTTVPEFIMTAAIGTVVSGALTVVGVVAAKILRSMRRFEANIIKMLASDEVKAANITKILEVERHMVKASRSHSYAFRELGVNGSATKALEHADAAEDILNGRASENAQAAMTADCGDGP